MSKGRRVPPVAPGQRRQEIPLTFWNDLHPDLRDNIIQLARAAHQREGRGALAVVISDEAETGIVQVDHFDVAEMADIAKSLPLGQAQPIVDAVNTYNPEQAFVVLVTDITPSLPGPQLWFDVVPYR